MTDDLYAVNAEYHDGVSAPMWSALREPLARALAPLQDITSPLVDLGTSAGTLALAATAPGAEILAVELSAQLRVGLMARVVDDLDRRRRVTVLPTHTDGARLAGLPTRVGGLSALYMLGHLDPAGRGRLWAELAQRLVPDGLAAVVLQRPPQPQHGPELRGRTARWAPHLPRQRRRGTGRRRPAHLDDALVGVAGRRRLRGAHRDLLLVDGLTGAAGRRGGRGRADLPASRRGSRSLPGAQSVSPVEGACAVGRVRRRPRPQPASGCRVGEGVVRQ